MLYAVQMQHGMPAVGALPQLAIAQVTKIEANMHMRGYEQRRPHRYHRHQGFGCPEDRLFNEGSIGISREKPTPNAVGTQRSC